jgi:hypothetical protein
MNCVSASLTKNICGKPANGTEIGNYIYLINHGPAGFLCKQCLERIC